MFAVVVTGLPGSGKTTLAAPLAAALGLPLLAKDALKEALADELGVDGPAAQTYGRAAVRRMFALATHLPEVVLESFFWPGLAEPDLLALNRPLVQVHCDCAPELARARFDARLADGSRHPVHHRMEEWASFSAGAGLLDLPGPLLSVDTTEPVSLAAVVRDVRSALAEVSRPTEG